VAQAIPASAARGRQLRRLNLGSARRADPFLRMCCRTGWWWDFFEGDGEDFPVRAGHGGEAVEGERGPGGIWGGAAEVQGDAVAGDGVV
jgi:hypothetical protein